MENIGGVSLRLTCS